MPYAVKDRQEFIERLGLRSDSRVLDIGGLLSEEVPSSISGITTPRPLMNPILIDPGNLPFKNSVFDAIVSYHYFDMISSCRLETMFKEISRVMNNEAILSFMTILWMPQTEPQRSNLFYNELLETTGLLFRHELEDISRQLSESGFSEISVESVTREIVIPEEFIRSHLSVVAKILKKEKEKSKELKILTKQYVAHVKMHGEAMLPAVNFTTRKT